MKTALLIHAENAFNSINRKVPLHNTEFTFVYKCYVIEARLFSIGGKEIRGCEETTQGDQPVLARGESRRTMQLFC